MIDDKATTSTPPRRVLSNHAINVRLVDGGFCSINGITSTYNTRSAAVFNRAILIAKHQDLHVKSLELLTEQVQSRLSVTWSETSPDIMMQTPVLCWC